MTEVAAAFVRVPQAAPAQPFPERDQVAPLLEGSFWTVTVKLWDCENWTLALAVVKTTAMGDWAVCGWITPAQELSKTQANVTAAN